MQVLMQQALIDTQLHHLLAALAAPRMQQLHDEAVANMDAINSSLEQVCVTRLVVSSAGACIMATSNARLCTHIPQCC
jgi:hypothetical protein